MTSTILTLVTFYAIVGKKNNRQPNLHFLHFLLLYQIIANVVVRCKSLTHGHNSSSVPRFGLIIKDNAGLTGHPFRLDRSAAAQAIFHVAVDCREEDLHFVQNVSIGVEVGIDLAGLIDICDENPNFFPDRPIRRRDGIKPVYDGF